MNRSRLALAAFVLGQFISFPVLAEQAPGGRKVIDQYVTWVRPSAGSLSAYVKEIDAALVIRVVSKLGTRAVPSQIDYPALLSNPALMGLPWLINEYRVEVLQVPKAHFSVAGGSTVTIARRGGELDWLADYRIVAHEDGIALVPDAEYLVFLEYSEELQAPMLSPWGALRVQEGIVTGNSRDLDFLSAITNQPAAAAVEAIRAAHGANEA